MVAKSYRELVCWQLAVQVREETIAIIPLSPRPQDRNLCDQLRRAVSSPPDNLAEGFGRFEPVDFAHFLTYAIASLDEVDNHLRAGVASGCFDAAKVAPLLVLCVRCRRASLGLRRYLLGRGRRFVAAWKARQQQTPP